MYINFLWTQTDLFIFDFSAWPDSLPKELPGRPAESSGIYDLLIALQDKKKKHPNAAGKWNRIDIVNQRL